MTLYELLKTEWFDDLHYLHLNVQTQEGTLYEVFPKNEQFKDLIFARSKRFTDVTFHELKGFLEQKVDHVYTYTANRFSNSIENNVIIVEVVLYMEKYYARER